MFSTPTLRALRRWFAVIVLLLVPLVAPYILINTPTFAFLGNEIALNLETLSYALVASVAVLSLVLLVGYNGPLALAASFYMGVGAYASIILIDQMGLPFPLPTIVSAVTCAALGLLIGFPALRIKGVYLALVTITFAAVFPALVRLPSLKEYTGGSDGLLLENDATAPSWLPIAEAPRILGKIPGIGPNYIGDLPLGAAQTGTVWTYFVVLLAAVVIFWLVAGIIQGRVGRSMIAVRDNEIAAAASGVNVARTKLLAFTISGAVGGLAGCLYAEVYRIVAPDNFGLTLAIYLLFGMILGGHRSMAGALIGGFAVAYLPAITSQVTHLPGVPDRYLKGPTASLTLGLLLILFSMLMPSGVASLIRHRTRRTATGPSTPEPPAPSGAADRPESKGPETGDGPSSRSPIQKSAAVD